MAFQGDEPIESMDETPDAHTGEPQEQGEPLPNPFDMTPEERRQWLAAASPEEKTAAILTYADPDDVVLSTAHLRAEKGKLGQERQELKRQQELILSLLAQAQQPQVQQPSQPDYALPPQPVQYYDPYATPDPAQERLNAIERQVQALDQTLQQQQQRQAQEEGARLIREEMQRLSQEFPFFGEADYSVLFAEMQRRNNPSPTAVFWQLYEQEAVDYKLAKAARGRQAAEQPASQAAAQSAPMGAVAPPTRGRGTAPPPQLRTLGSPEEFVADLIKAGYVSPNLNEI